MVRGTRKITKKKEERGRREQKEIKERGER